MGLPGLVEHVGTKKGEHAGTKKGEHAGSPLRRVVQWFKTIPMSSDGKWTGCIQIMALGRRMKKRPYSAKHDP